MTPAVWVALGLWVAAVAVQTLTTLLSGRLRRLEQDLRTTKAACEAGVAALRRDCEASLTGVRKDMQDMKDKASDEGDRRQKFVNEVEIRLDRMEQRLVGFPGGPRARR